MKPKIKRSKKEIKILNSYLKFMRASNSIEAKLSRNRSEDGLTMSQLGVLEALYHLGPMNQKDIAQKLLSSGSNIVTVIDNLEKSELVKRNRDTSDRRNIIINLTEKGDKLIEDVFEKHATDIINEFGILTAEELDELGRICKKIGLKD